MKVTYNRTLISALAVIGVLCVGMAQTDPSSLGQGNSTYQASPQTGSYDQSMSLDTANAPKIMVSGTEVSFVDARPGIVSGQLFVPIRTVAEQIGAKVEWNHEAKQVSLDVSGQTVQLTSVPSLTALIGGDQGRAEQFSGSTPGTASGMKQVVLINNRAYMPFDQLATVLNATGTWDKEAGTATITPNTSSPDASPDKGTPPDNGAQPVTEPQTAPENPSNSTSGGY